MNKLANTTAFPTNVLAGPIPGVTEQPVLARDNRRRLYSLGNMLWHSDSSFKPVPAKYSILSGARRGDQRRRDRVRRHARRL